MQKNYLVINIILILGAVLLLGCEGPKDAKEFAIVSDKEAAKFRFILPSETTGYWTPSKDDIVNMDSTIRKYLQEIIADPYIDSYEKEFIKDKAKTVLNRFDFYRRQYIGILIKGERRIFCNAGVADPLSGNWRTEPIHVADGGAGFWRIQYIPKDNKCIEFETNGEA